MKTNLTIEELNAHKEDYKLGNPSVYCGTYHKYNCGSIEGMWIDLTTFCDYEDFIDFCRALHADEDDPELMFQDYENFPREWYCESCFGEKIFNQILEYAELDEDEQKAFEEFLDYKCDSEITVEDFKQADQGVFDSEEEFAEYLFKECYQVPEYLESYIDYERFARELFMSDYEMCGNHVVNMCM